MKTIQDVGAIQDGRTDTSTPINSGMAQMMTTSNGGDLVVPANLLQARIAAPLAIPDMRLRGEGIKASVIGAMPGFSGPAMVTQARVDGTQEFAAVEDLKLAGGWNAPTAISFGPLGVPTIIRNVTCNQCTGPGIVLRSPTLASSVIRMESVWSGQHGAESLLVDCTTGGMRSLWIEDLTAESPPAGYAAVRIVASGGRLYGVHILGLHLETNLPGSIGLILDGVTVLSASNIVATASDGGSWQDVIQIKGASHGIRLDTIYARPGNITGSLINDMTNARKVQAPASGYLSEYKV